MVTYTGALDAVSICLHAGCWLLPFQNVVRVLQPFAQPFFARKGKAEKASADKAQKGNKAGFPPVQNTAGGDFWIGGFLRNAREAGSIKQASCWMIVLERLRKSRV